LIIHAIPAASIQLSLTRAVLSSLDPVFPVFGLRYPFRRKPGSRKYVPNRPALMSDRRACSSRDRWLKPGERGRFYLSDQLPGSRLDGGSHRSPYLHSEVVPTTQDAERPRAWRNQKCRTLITNDDGLSSGGVRALAAAAVGAGLEVTVVVPNWDSSGSGASLTAVSERGQVLVERNEDGWPAGISALGVHGPPALIVRAAVFGAFGPPPHVVLSGVNGASTPDGRSSTRER
jgi:hypothetical protein